MDTTVAYSWWDRISLHVSLRTLNTLNKSQVFDTHNIPACPIQKSWFLAALVALFLPLFSGSVTRCHFGISHNPTLTLTTIWDVKIMISGQFLTLAMFWYTPWCHLYPCKMAGYSDCHQLGGDWWSHLAPTPLECVPDQLNQLNISKMCIKTVRWSVFFGHGVYSAALLCFGIFGVLQESNITMALCASLSKVLGGICCKK